jgi:hypothetical protein
MKKTFLKSIATGVVGLTLIGGCSMFNKEAAHSCKANSCKAKKESHGCSGKKDAKASTKKETSSCSAKKASTHKCSAAKTETKTDEK